MKTRSFLPFAALVASAIFAAPAATPDAAAGELVATISKPTAPSGIAAEHADKIGYWLISEDGKPVLQYNYAVVTKPAEWVKHAKKSAYLRKYGIDRSNYIHPLWNLDGKEVITGDWRSDHGHHRGIYWAWPEVAYAAAPKKLQDLHALQEIFAHPTGLLDVRKNADASLSITAENLWFWSNKTPIVRELATITVFPRGTDSRRFTLDLQLTALADGVTIARRHTKHYGGLNVRMEKLAGWKALSFSDKKKPAANPAWTGATWKTAGTGTGTVGELFAFEKATNPCYPGEFVTYPDLNWFQPTFPTKNTRYPLKKDAPLKLSFQFWLHEGESTHDARAAAWKAFQDAK
jgi:hypothetical protein